MVTVHRAFGYRFMMFTNDHSPPHVHVFGPQGEAKIVLAGPGDPFPERVAGIGRGDLRRILKETHARRDALLLEWTRIHG